MRKKERAALILRRLEEHYPEPPVPLDHSDSFTLLVAVLLSAQCTDKKVNEVTPALFAAGPTPAAMAGLAEETILGHIRQLGLARTKARNVKRLAELLLERHGGEVPRSFEALEALPGVGHKTASVVMAQAFGVPAFPVDTHIHRLAARAWSAPSAISSCCSPAMPGTGCTSRSFSMAVSSARPAVAMAPCARSAASFIRSGGGRCPGARPEGEAWRDQP